jgi:trigger factor
MKTDVVDAGPFERLMTLRLAEPELESAKERVSRRLSKELKIKGFRPGKAPRAIVERMVGAERFRGEAIDEALPEAVAEAIVEAELKPVTTPRVEAVRDAEDGAIEVDVRVTLWPSADELPDYGDREVTVEIREVEDDDVAEQIDRLRNQFAELEEVDRPGDTGDFMLINITALARGTEIEEASASDLLYEIGSQSFIPGLDELLVAAGGGDIREGPATLPEGFGDHAGEEVTLRVLVKGVRAKKLPEVTDEWVTDVSEFDSVDELESMLRDNLVAISVNAARGAFQEDLVKGLIDDLDVDLPEGLVQAEMEAGFHNLYHSLEGQGIDMATYLQVTGQDEEGLSENLRESAVRSLSTRVLLEGVAEAEAIEVDEAEMAEALDDLAASSGKSIDEVRSALESSGQEQSLASDILRRKALDVLMDGARAVNADGEPIDLSAPEPEDDRADSPDEPSPAGDEADQADQD